MFIFSLTLKISNLNDIVVFWSDKEYEIRIFSIGTKIQCYNCSNTIFLLIIKH